MTTGMTKEEELLHSLVAFTAAVHQVKHDLTKELRIEAVTPVQYGILELLAVEQPVTLSKLSDCLNMSMPNTSREIRKLGEKGLCEKMPAPDDQRKQHIRLSPEGQRLMDEVFGRLKASLRKRIGDVSDERLEELQRAVRLLHQAVF